MSPVKLWHNAWDGIKLPVSNRLNKPRSVGQTMIMDKGLGLKDTIELMSVASPYIDFVKFGFGTSALYDEKLLMNKISILRSYDIHVYPGGTFLEIALHQNSLDYFLQRAKELGFSAIEVSDGTLPVSPDTRRNTIKAAKDMGFTVISEVGKKDMMVKLNKDQVIELIEADLEAGSQMVIIEARESGKGIGIYNDKGDIDKGFFEEIVSDLPNKASIMWEAPLKKQQEALILTFGPNVNLGNIAPAEVLALESLRTGLRGDTFKAVIENSRPGLPI